MHWDRCNFEHTLAAADCESVEVDALMLPPRMALPWHLELMKALIEDAIVHADLEWINRESDDVLSFRNCCELLGVDVEAARKELNAKIAVKKPARKKLSTSQIALDIADVPGVQYSHNYGDCARLSKCAECRQRYNHRYSALYRRGIRQRRRAFSAPWHGDQAHAQNNPDR